MATNKPVTPPKPKKTGKFFEFRVYKLASNYSGDYDLIATVNQRFQNVFTDHGCPVAIAKQAAEEFVRNIGMFGITVENPRGLWTYFPPAVIAKVEYDIVAAESDNDPL